MTPRPPQPRAGAALRGSAAALALLLGLALPARGSYISFAFTNAFTGAPVTNAFVVQKVGDTLADGSVIGQGFPTRVTPAADGRATNWLATGNYYVTNTAASPPFNRISFRAPEDTSATVYFFLSAGVWISGGNFFVTLSGGTNGPPSFSQVTNALGYAPLTPAQNTNLTAAAIPTNFWSTSATAWLSNVAFLGTNGLASTNFVNAATNVLKNNLTTLITTTSNGLQANLVASTNGLGGAAFKRTNDFVASNNGRGTNATFHGTLDLPGGGPLTIGSTVSIDDEVATFGAQITLTAGSGQITADQFLGDFVGTGSGITGLASSALTGIVPIGLIPSLPGSRITNAVPLATAALSSLIASNLYPNQVQSNQTLVTAPFVQATNFAFASLTNLVQDTNLIVILRAGTAAATNGIYVWDGARFTNTWNGYTYSNNGAGALLLRDASGSSLYSFAGVIGTSTVVGGASPFAIAAYGFRFIGNGIFFDGIVTDTNTQFRITNAVAGASNALQTAIAGKQAALAQLGTSNATVKPLLFGGTNLFALEAGGNITLTPGATSIVVSASGGGSGSGISSNFGTGTSNILYSALVSNAPAINVTNLTVNGVITGPLIIGSGSAAISGTTANEVVIGSPNSTISSPGADTVIIGGNAHLARGNESVIAGGTKNAVLGANSFIAAGQNNTNVGDNSFVGGQLASGSNTTVFVWSDGSRQFVSTASKQFLVQATNGIGFNTNDTGAYAMRLRGAFDATAGVYSNGVPLLSASETNGMTSIVYSNATTLVTTNDPRGISLTHTGNVLFGTFNGRGTISNAAAAATATTANAATNATSALNASNVMPGIIISNAAGRAWASLQVTNSIIGTGITNYSRSTNYVATYGAGTTNANHTYAWLGSLYTNSLTGNTWSNNGTLWLNRNLAGTTLYSATSLDAGTVAQIGGALPVPTVSYGAEANEDGIVHTGPFLSASVTGQIGNAVSVASNALQNTITGRVGTGTNVFYLSGALFALTNLDQSFIVDGVATWASTGDVGPAYYVNNGIAFTDNGWRAVFISGNRWDLTNTVIGLALASSTNFPFIWWPSADFIFPDGPFLAAPFAGTEVAPFAAIAQQSYSTLSPAIVPDNAFRLPTRGWDSYGAQPPPGAATDVYEITITNTMKKFYEDGLVAAGWRNFTLDEGWPKTARAANGNLQPVDTIQDGIAFLADFAHARGELLGIHLGTGSGSSGQIFGSQQYARQDATNLIGFCHADKFDLDGYSATTDVTITNEQIVAEMIYRELLTASITYGRPVHVNLNFASLYGGNFQPWMAQFNWWNIDSDGSVSTNGKTAWAAFKARWQDLTNQFAWTRPGHFPNSSTITYYENNTNYFRGALGMIAMAPMSTFVNGTNYSADILSIMKNEDLKSIHFDADCRPNFAVSNTASFEVWARPLTGGRVALAFFNKTNTGAFTPAVSSASFGISTNLTCVAHSVWWGTNTVFTGSFTGSVGTNTAELFIITPGLTADVTAWPYTALPLGITNTTVGGRSQPVVQYYLIDAAGGNPALTASNETTGMKLLVGNAALAALTETNFFTLPVTAPGQVWRLRDESGGTGASVGVVTNWQVGL